MIEAIKKFLARWKQVPKRTWMMLWLYRHGYCTKHGLKRDSYNYDVHKDVCRKCSQEISDRLTARRERDKILDRAREQTATEYIKVLSK